jgi:hypothetical protein
MMSTGGPMLSMSHLQGDAEWTNERVGMARRSTFTARGRSPSRCRQAQASSAGAFTRAGQALLPGWMIEGRASIRTSLQEPLAAVGSPSVASRYLRFGIGAPATVWSSGPRPERPAGGMTIGRVAGDRRWKELLACPRYAVTSPNGLARRAEQPTRALQAGVRRGEE